MTCMCVQVVENVKKMLTIELMVNTHSLQLRKQRDPSFKIPTPLLPVYERCAQITPCMVNDRYLKPDYDQLLEYITAELPRMASVVNADVATPEAAAAMQEAIEHSKNVSEA